MERLGASRSSTDGCPWVRRRFSRSRFRMRISASQDVIDTSWIDTSWIDTSWIDTSWIDTWWIDTSWIDTSWIDTSWIDTSWGEADEAIAKSQGPAPNSISFAKANKSIIINWSPRLLVERFRSPKCGRLWGRSPAGNPPNEATPAGGLTPAQACTTTAPITCKFEDFATDKNKLYYYFVVSEFTTGEPKRTRSEIFSFSR